MTSKSKNVANILYDSVLSTVNTIQTTDDLYIEANGSSKTLFLDCDADDSVINIGVKSGQNKNINIGNQGTGIITMNENAKILKTTDTTASFSVSNTTGYGNKSYISTGCSGGGALYMISNGQGSSYCGIPHALSGICSYWGDMVLATGNGSTHSEKLRLSTTAITPSASIIPNTTATYDIGSTTKYFNNGYITTLNTTNANVNTLTTGLITTSSGSIQLSPTTQVEIVKDLIPTTGTINLGSASNKFDNLFVNNLNMSTLNVSSAVYSPQLLTASNLVLKSTTAGILIMAGTDIKVLNDFLPYTVDTYNIGSSALHFNNMYANSFNTMSDFRLKNNIRPLNKGLELIEKLNAVEFNYKSDKNNKDVYGFIAQDVEKIINDDNQSIIKIPTKDDEFYAIEYTQFIPIIIKSIQELSKEIKSINTGTITQDNKSYVDEIDILKNEIELLKSEITKLKKDLKKIKS